ncbi:MAG: response regulator [Desulfuromonadales bacterium]|nr:response regulator [Desulfuromonadales bacterium]
MNRTSARILVVDDSPTVRRLAELILSQQGYSVHTAEDGEKGLKMAQEILPDVILVDFIMPRMNGHTFCREVRANPATREIPLILISSKGEKVGGAFSEQFGVVDTFSKPFEPDDLVQKLAEVLRAHPRQGSAPPLPPLSASHVAAAAEGEMVSEILERFEKMVRGYFQKDFPLLMKNVLTDTLLENGVIKGGGLVFSGDLGRIPLPDVLNFAGNSRLSGRLSVFSREIFGEIFLDAGRFVFATVSRKEGSQFLTDLIAADGKLTAQALQQAVREGFSRNTSVGRILVENGLLTDPELMGYLQRHAQDAFNIVLEVTQGQFFLEQESLPPYLQDITFRLPLTHVLLDGLRQLDEKQLAASEFKDEGMVLVRLITNEDALESFALGEKELQVFAIIDGRRSMAEIVRASGLPPLEVKRICYTLRRVGLLRPKAG